MWPAGDGGAPSLRGSSAVLGRPGANSVTQRAPRAGGLARDPPYAARHSAADGIDQLLDANEAGTTDCRSVH